MIRPVVWIMQLPARIRSSLRKHKQKKRLARRCPKTAYPQYGFGKGTYGTPKVYNWGEGSTLQVGAYCSIADGAQIFLGGEHRTDWVTTYPFPVFWEAATNIQGHPRSKGDVIIGNDVWIGTEATFLSGVKVGDGAVIGAKSVVVKDVPPYAIVAGNPARVIKMRFDDDTVARLLRVKWWEWDDARIERALPLLLQEDTQAFLCAVENREI
jgi:acetyltransferase-like isoleucine patch superfamily enzyme